MDVPTDHLAIHSPTKRLPTMHHQRHLQPRHLWAYQQAEEHRWLMDDPTEHMFLDSPTKRLPAKHH